MITEFLCNKRHVVYRGIFDAFVSQSEENKKLVSARPALALQKVWKTDRYNMAFVQV